MLIKFRTLSFYYKDMYTYGLFRKPGTRLFFYNESIFMIFESGSACHSLKLLIEKEVFY